MNLLKILKKFFSKFFWIKKIKIEPKIIIETNNVLDILLPEKYRWDFQIKTLQEYKNEWKLEVIEKKWKIPKELEGKDIVLDWYCNPIEIVDFPFKWKPMYINFKRRKRKERWTTKWYTNNYTLHQPWLKATNEFWFFFKGLNWEERSEFFSTRKDIRYLR